MVNKERGSSWRLRWHHAAGDASQERNLELSFPPDQVLLAKVVRAFVLSHGGPAKNEVVAYREDLALLISSSQKARGKALDAIDADTAIVTLTRTAQQRTEVSLRQGDDMTQKHRALHRRQLRLWKCHDDRNGTYFHERRFKHQQGGRTKRTVTAKSKLHCPFRANLTAQCHTHEDRTTKNRGITAAWR